MVHHFQHSELSLFEASNDEKIKIHTVLDLLTDIEGAETGHLVLGDLCMAPPSSTGAPKGPTSSLLPPTLDFSSFDSLGDFFGIMNDKMEYVRDTPPQSLAATPRSDASTAYYSPRTEVAIPRNINTQPINGGAPRCWQAKYCTLH